MCPVLKMRALAVGLSIAATLALAGPALAATTPATTLYVSGGGYGHGIGMSQYGAYGYALHGWTYQQILAHYYTGTTLGKTDPDQTVRVLLGSGSAAFAGATHVGNKSLNPSLTYDVVPLANGSLKIVNQSSGKAVGTFSAPLTAVGPGPLSVAGLGAYRGSLEFRPNGSGGVYTVNVVGLDDYVQGVIAAEMPSTWSSQALDAQAVAARTYAITTDVSGSFFNLYPDTRSQMYRGRCCRDGFDRRRGRRHVGPDRRVQRRARCDLLLRQLRRLHRERRGRVAGRDPRSVAAGSARSRTTAPAATRTTTGRGR